MNEYKIFSENIEKEAIEQFHSACSLPYVTRAALMPDAHLGYSLPIGAVVETEGMVMPSWVGYDIGCGVSAYKTRYYKDQIEPVAQEIYNKVISSVPLGFNHHKEDQIWLGWGLSDISEFMKNTFSKNGLKQLGTLGGGNHFIEVGYGQDNKVWIIVHSGSRNIGHTCATYYMKLACGEDKAREGHFGFELNTPAADDYLKDMKFCLDFALMNREHISHKVRSVLNEALGYNMEFDFRINRTHNHAEVKGSNVIHRKGATHAEEGMGGVIPGNMRDGSFIVRGKGNVDSLCSSSHGAGRVLGRKAAKKMLCGNEFEIQMRGIVAKVGESTLDESPSAYKDIFAVIGEQRDLVEVVDYIKPIINVKG